MDNGIAYQNKDVLSKYFAEGLAGKSLEVYGIEIPRISRYLSVDFPVIMANELFSDNLYLLEDNSICIVDYESKYTIYLKVKYLRYVTQVLTRYEKIKIDPEKMSEDAIKELTELRKVWGRKIPNRIRVIVIYTGDVKAGSTKPDLDLGSAKITVQEAFLSELHTDEIVRKLEDKIEAGVRLTDWELMEYVIIPLSVKGKREKQKLANKMLELTDQLEDDDRRFLLSGMCVAGNRIYSEEIQERLRRRLTMTKVGMMFEKEKEEAVKAMEKKKDKEIAVLNAENKKKDQQIKNSDRQLKKKDQQIAKKDQQMSEKDQQLAKKDQQIEKLKAEIKRLGGSVAAL
ncbi:MAG: hypothetical protein IK078_07840 [Lachnospiraceae bacterium]|nr:hypothetical protein [Lachnospiraceae bacterium]